MTLSTSHVRLGEGPAAWGGIPCTSVAASRGVDEDKCLKHTLKSQSRRPKAGANVE